MTHAESGCGAQASSSATSGLAAEHDDAQPLLRRVRDVERRGELLVKPAKKQDPQALFLNFRGGRLTTRSV